MCIVTCEPGTLKMQRLCPVGMHNRHFKKLIKHHVTITRGRHSLVREKRISKGQDLDLGSQHLRAPSRNTTRKNTWIFQFLFKS